MITLAFDTALDKMYVVLKKDVEVVESRIVETTKEKYHSAYLVSTIADVLKGEKPDLIAVNIGPGSFTGIRACVTVARVMAQQLNIKAVGISSLEILSKLNPTDKPTLVALDARKNMAYLMKTAHQVRGDIKAVPLDEIKTDGYFVITDDKLQPILGGISYQQGDYALGEILAELAQKRGGADWRKLLPLYIQPPAVHVTKIN